MDPGDWIAVYAAVVGTAALGYELLESVLARRPRVQVSFMLTHRVLTGDDARVMATRPETIATPWEIGVEVLNAGRAQVQVAAVRISTSREEFGMDVWTSRDWGLPWVLDPGE